MTQRFVSQTAPVTRENSPEELPLSVLLFRYLWPFWLFRDASHGDLLARAAAYRHNRGMRVYLPGYLKKWTVSTALAWAVTRGFEALSSHGSGSPDVFLLMAAGAGMLFATGVCMLFVTGYIYLYLSRHLH